MMIGIPGIKDPDEKGGGANITVEGKGLYIFED